jgi:hypothetical protein
MSLEEIVNAVRALPPNEQAELLRRLEALTEKPENGNVNAESQSHWQRKDLHERIHRAMYEAGLVTAINPPVKRRRERPPPIKIKGKPVSETIIEDRR